ncbi:MIP/aquaporin family protein [Kribbella hippodromi]|uniref:MIP/aquaporin family protein n=1 Tax=Kribbella hippodromi TaxID=434347 RepID=A0ABP4QHZ7_9ACTN
MPDNNLRQRLGTELLGTAILVFVGVGAVPATLLLNGSAPMTMADLGMISFAFAAAVIGTAYALGPISGNHINPAVTIGLAVSGKFPWAQVPGYLAAQLAGALLGAGAIIGVLGSKASDLGLGIAAYGPGVGTGQAFMAEFVGTFILVLTVFGATHRRAAAGFAGLAIGFVVFAVIIPIAPITGASVNPARTVGPMLIQQLAGGQVQFSQLPIYVLAELTAGALAGLTFLALSRTTTPTTAPVTAPATAPGTAAGTAPATASATAPATAAASAPASASSSAPTAPSSAPAAAPSSAPAAKG